MIPDRTPDFSLYHTDPEINALIRPQAEVPGQFRRHFNASEEFFLRFRTPLVFPSLEIHHDYSNPVPSAAYQQSLKDFLRQILPEAGPLFSETAWYFNPKDIFHPGFYQLYEVQGSKYLFVLKLDLGIRPRGCDILTPGTNDKTAVYRSTDLYLEAEILPLEAQSENRRDLWIKKVFQETLTGEKGRGYHLQGVWIDHSLTKFLTKVLLPTGKKIYPYYPFQCRHGTLSSSVVDFTPRGRHRSIVLLDKAMKDLLPEATAMQQALAKEDFSEKMPLFQDLHSRLEPSWAPYWKDIRLEARLNEDEQKEFTFYDQE